MQELGIQPTARHANPLIFAEAMFVSAHTAINGPLKEMQQGRLGEGCRPNADSYNCIIMVRSMLWDCGRFQNHKSLVLCMLALGLVAWHTYFPRSQTWKKNACLTQLLLTAAGAKYCSNL